MRVAEFFSTFVAMKEEFINKLKRLLVHPKKIVLVPHYNPDGDAMGSTLGLQLYLSKIGHDAVVITPNDYPEVLAWMPQIDNTLNFYRHREKVVQKVKETDLIIALDFNNLNRIEKMGEIIRNSNAIKVKIDHHQDPEDFADLVYSDPKKASTCEMVYEVLEVLGLDPIDQEIATCLYTGIVTDTGSFQYIATNSKTHLIASKLIDHDVKPHQIYKYLFQQHTVGRIKLVGLALSNLKKVPGLPATYMAITKKNLDDHQYKKGDTNGLVNYGLTIADNELSVLLIEDAKVKKIKYSFRSKSYFSTNKFASRFFNGGGHLNASGGYYLGNMEDAIKKLLYSLKQVSHEFS